MPIDVTCPDCFQEFSVKDSLAGKKIRCKECQGVIKVPAESSAVDEEGDLTQPPQRRSKSSAAGKSVKRTATGKKRSVQGRWAEVPWLGAGIPIGAALTLFLLSQILPFGTVYLFVMLTWTMTALGCALGGLYMLARVSSRLYGDIQASHLRGARKVGGADIAIAFASFSMAFVFIKGLIYAPQKTVPWFLMMVLGICGLVWIGTFSENAFKPPAQKSAPPSGWDEQSWKKWEDEIRQPTPPQ